MTDLLNDRDRTQWTLDSYQISVDSYTHMMAAQEEISSEYAKIVYETVIQKQIALAGYRTADLIIEIFEKTTDLKGLKLQFVSFLAFFLCILGFWWDFK